MSYFVPLNFVIGVCLGIGLGYFLKAFLFKESHPSPIGKVSGALPRWRVEFLADEIVRTIGNIYPNPKDKIKLEKLAQSIHVALISPEDPHNTVRTWGVFSQGRVVRVLGGSGWEKRFALSFAHALRLLFRGDADNLRQDSQWFIAALQFLRREQDASAPGSRSKNAA